jgi:hypothetical protein
MCFTWGFLLWFFYLIDIYQDDLLYLLKCNLLPFLTP